MYDENSLTGHRTVVDELRRQIERSHATWDALDKKATTLFQSAGVLITLAGFIKLAILQQRLSAWSSILIAGALVAFAALYAVLFLAAGPRQYRGTVPITWEEQNERYFFEDDRTVLERLIADYDEAVPLLGAANIAKGRALRIAGGLFVLIVTLLLAAVYVSN